LDLASISTTLSRPDFWSRSFKLNPIIIHCIITMGKTILASLLALASISSGIVASPPPRPSTVERSSTFPVDDTFKWVEGSGFHLVQCSPLPSSAEQTWLSAVIVSAGHFDHTKSGDGCLHLDSTARRTPIAATSSTSLKSATFAFERAVISRMTTRRGRSAIGSTAVLKKGGGSAG